MTALLLYIFDIDYISSSRCVYREISMHYLLFILILLKQDKTFSEPIPNLE